MERAATSGFNVLEFIPGKIENLANLLTQDRNVIIIRSFLNMSEAEKFSRYGEKLFAENPAYPLLPKSFYNVHRLIQSNNITEDYYNEIAEFARNSETYSDLNRQILNFFELSGLDLMNKTDKNLARIPASTFRIIKKDFAPIYSHCEKYLLNLYPICKKMLADRSVDTNTHYSYFIQLSKPQKGGELVLLKTDWNETKKKNDFQIDALVNENGIVMDISDIEKYNVPLNIGDLLIFDGGNIWHAITHVESSDARITFGGFINPSLEPPNSFFIWS